MGNNLIPTAMAIGEKYIYFLFHLYKNMKVEKIGKGIFSTFTNDGVDPYDYHLAKCGEGAFETMECNQIHRFHPNEEAEEDVVEEDFWIAHREIEFWAEEQKILNKPAYCKGNNEMVMIFNRKCVICFEKSSAHEFHQCGHQCVYDICWNSSTVKMLNCAVCRT